MCECVFLSVIGDEVYNKKETHVPNNEQTFVKNPHSIFQQQQALHYIYIYKTSEYCYVPSSHCTSFFRVEIVFIHIVLYSYSGQYMYVYIVFGL